jgi:hypothetical protein
MQFGVGGPARYVDNDRATAKEPLARFMTVYINTYVKLLIYEGEGGFEPPLGCLVPKTV